MAAPASSRREIPGTPIFDGNASRRGLALNQMCYSFNQETSREEFHSDPNAYCKKFGLDEEVTAAVLDADVLALLNAGGSIYYLAKLTGILGWDMQDVGARQAGITREEFEARLYAAGG